MARSIILSIPFTAWLVLNCTGITCNTRLGNYWRLAIKQAGQQSTQGKKDVSHLLINYWFNNIQKRK